MPALYPRRGWFERKKLATVVSDSKDANAVRRRRSTANRLLTILKAALNHAFHDGRVLSDDAWRKAKPYREVDAPVVLFLFRNA